MSDLHVALKQPLDVFVGGVLAESCREVLQLVQKSIQTLTQLWTTTQKTELEKIQTNVLSVYKMRSLKRLHCVHVT